MRDTVSEANRKLIPTAQLMKIYVRSDYASTAIGAAGTGAQWLWPDQRWLGMAMLIFAGIIFAFGIRYDGTVKTGDPRLGALKLNLYVAAMIASAVVFAIALSFYVAESAKRPAHGAATAVPLSVDNPPMSKPVEGVGGQGGSASVLGNGIAIGGPGGAAGRFGRGGDGGGGQVDGDGMAVGGAGGAAGDVGVWRPPAKSGYEIAQRRLGLPVDPIMRQYGRGGAGSGYEPKLRLVEQLRAEYFQAKSISPKSVFENINAMPVDAINRELEVKGEAWRVRIVDDEYEFFLPGH